MSANNDELYKHGLTEEQLHIFLQKPDIQKALKKFKDELSKKATVGTHYSMQSGSSVNAFFSNIQNIFQSFSSSSSPSTAPLDISEKSLTKLVVLALGVKETGKENLIENLGTKKEWSNMAQTAEKLNHKLMPFILDYHRFETMYEKKSGEDDLKCVVLLCYSVSNRESFEQVKACKAYADEAFAGSKAIILVANKMIDYKMVANKVVPIKTNLKERVVTEEEGRALCAELGFAQYIEPSETDEGYDAILSIVKEKLLQPLIEQESTPHSINSSSSSSGSNVSPRRF